MLTIVVGRVSVKLNDSMHGCWCQPGTGMACYAPSGSPPNGGVMRFILDESHQKEVITYHFLSVFAYSFSSSCSRSDCIGFHKLKGERVRQRNRQEKGGFCIGKGEVEMDCDREK